MRGESETAEVQPAVTELESLPSSSEGSVSQLFAGYRAVGIVCDEVAVAYRAAGASGAGWVATCAGAAVHVYETGHLRLQWVCAPHPAPVRAVALSQRFVCAASGSEVYVWRRGRLVGLLDAHSAPVCTLLALGDRHLVSADTSGRVCTWLLRAPHPTSRQTSKRRQQQPDVTSKKLRRERRSSDSGSDDESSAQHRTEEDQDTLSDSEETMMLGQNDDEEEEAAEAAEAVTAGLDPSEWMLAEENDDHDDHDDQDSDVEENARQEGDATRRSAVSLLESAQIGRLLGSIQLEQGLRVSALLHPHTYLNKILVGTEQGVLLLLNVRTGQVIHRYEGWSSAVRSLAQSPALDVCAVGLADGRVLLFHLRRNRVLFRLRHVPEQLGNLTTQAATSVSSLAFRLDGPPQLVTGGADGSLALWNLTTRSLIFNSPAHHAAISSLHALAGLPLLLSSAGDNALRVWQFPPADAITVGQSSFRLVRQRSGHHGAPSSLDYYGISPIRGTPANEEILSACQSDRSLRSVSAIRDRLSMELSQRPGLAKKASRLHVHPDRLKLPPIRQMSSTPTMEERWDNVVTCHVDHPFAYSWNYMNRTLGKHKLRCRAPGAPQNLTSVHVTGNGHYALLGSAGGWIDRYSLQSGAHRGSFNMPSPKQPKKANTGEEGKIAFVTGGLSLRGRQQAFASSRIPAHDGPVTGLWCDQAGVQVLSASLDGTLRWWAGTGALEFQRTVHFGAAIEKMEVDRQGRLAAISCEDSSVRVVDIVAGRVVRVLRGFQRRVTDLAFSADSRWLLVSSMDSCIRVYDLLSGALLDWFQTPTPATAITISPAGDFLATSHVGCRAICLWANRNHFESVFLTPVGDRPIRVALPGVGGAEDDLVSDDEDDDDLMTDQDREPDAEELQRAEAMAQLQRLAGLALKPDPVVEQEMSDAGGTGTAHTHQPLTLSGLPRHRWRHLHRLEEIRKRTRPVAAEDKPAPAPFFLDQAAADDDNVALAAFGDDADDPFRAAADFFGVSAAGGKQQQQQQSHVTRNESALPSTSFLQVVLTASQASDAQQAGHQYERALTQLQEMGPAAVSLELQSISSHDNGVELGAVLRMLLYATRSRSRIEFTQALLRTVLRYHASSIHKHPHLVEVATELLDAQRSRWQGVEAHLQHVLCLLSSAIGLH
mmetsp:Transcript_44471/g.112048  ORF Transcript_44471/g.112048 Transcript_44471/m.112048 type:complete len:1166 (-) Transcript_44471:55-3552(-)